MPLITFATTFLFLANCHDTGYSPAEDSEGQPYEDYVSDESIQGSAEIRLKTHLRPGMIFSNIWLDVQKVEVHLKSDDLEDDDDDDDDDDNSNHIESNSYVATNFFHILNSGKNSYSSYSENDDDQEEADDENESDDDLDWLDIGIIPARLDAILFTRNQMVLTAGAYNLEPGTYNQVRVTLGPERNVVINGQTYPLYVKGQEGHGEEHSSHAANGKIKIHGDITVQTHKLTGAVIDFDPVNDITAYHGNMELKTSSHGKNVISAYQIENNFKAEPVATLGSNFPLPSTDYKVLKNITLDKVEACIGEEIRVETSFVNPVGVPGEIMINVSNSNGGAPAIVIFHESGLKMLLVSATSNSIAPESVKIPVMINDCTVNNPLFVQAVDNPDFNGNTFHVNAPGMSSENTVYHWNFDDGQTETTTLPTVTHSFHQRVQNSRTDSFIVSVTAENPTETRTGSTSISLMNPHFISALYRGKYSLDSSSEPFLKKTVSGYTASFELKNPGNLNVNLSDVVQSLKYCDSSLPETITTHNASNLLGTASLASFDTFSGQINLSSIPDGVCSISFIVSGNTVTGNIAAHTNLYFGIEATGTKTLGAKRVNSAKQIKIQKAMKELNYPRKITEEDILKLELQGRI
jgi:hypothetical protein